jgi:hypothetical protein
VVLLLIFTAVAMASRYCLAPTGNVSYSITHPLQYRELFF